MFGRAEFVDGTDFVLDDGQELCPQGSSHWPPGSLPEATPVTTDSQAEHPAA